MNLLKTFAATAAIALASFGANASPVTSGGITWDPDYTSGLGNDFIASALYSTTDNSGIVSGWGNVGTLNGRYSVAIPGLSDGYCAYGSSCQLSFVFSDLANGGTLDFYVNAVGVDSAIEASAGDKWLSLEAVIVDQSPDTYSSQFDVFFNAVDEAGTVFSNFNTNTMENGTDVAVVASAFLSGTSANTGTATFSGDSIPEPTSIALFGLALMGLAGAARRKA